MGANIVDGYDTLKAAQDAAYWAGVSALAAWLIGFTGLILNAVAAYFLWHQLRASREALSSATEAANAATAGIRPWIQIAIDPDASVHVQPGMCILRTDVTFKNIGKTPALECQLHVKAVLTKSADGIGVDEVHETALGIEGSGSYIGHTLFPDEQRTASGPYQLVFSQHEKPSAMLLVVFSVTYRRSGGRQWKASPAVRMMTWLDPKPAESLVSEGDFKVLLHPVFDWGLEPT